MTEKRLTKYVQDNALKQLKNKITEFETIENKSDSDKQIIYRLSEAYADFTGTIAYFSAIDVLMAIGKAIHGK